MEWVSFFLIPVWLVCCAHVFHVCVLGDGGCTVNDSSLQSIIINILTSLSTMV